VQAEKLFGVHDKAFPLRVLARLPVGALSIIPSTQAAKAMAAPCVMC